MKGAVDSERRTRQVFTRYFPVVTAFVTLIVFAVTIIRVLTPSAFRYTLVLNSDPVIVVSLDPKRERATATSISRDVVLRGTMGYGKFPLGSLIALDTMDKRSGALVRGSVSRALGLPVDYVFDRGGMTITDPLTARSLRALFSIVTKPASLGWVEWLRLIRAISSLSADGLQLIDLSSASAPALLPDGSTVVELDETRVDAVLGSAFFDTEIREESLSVAVYNTTNTAEVGRITARQLTHIGVRLVLVGNKTPAVSRCRILGRKEVLVTHTARFLGNAYGCETVINAAAGSDVGADMIFELGEEEARIYSTSPSPSSS